MRSSIAFVSLCVSAPVLEAEDRLARTRTDAATSLVAAYFVAAYKALGGDWEEAPLLRYTAGVSH